MLQFHHGFNHRCNLGANRKVVKLFLRDILSLSHCEANPLVASALTGL